MKTDDEQLEEAAIEAAIRNRGFTRERAIEAVERWGAADVLLFASTPLPRPNGTPPARRTW